MRKKILKVFFVILTGITVTLTGCELSVSNESAQTESESGKDAVKFIPNLTTAVTRKPTPTAVAANPGDSVQNQQSGNNAEAEIYQSQGDPADQESAQEETYDIQYITAENLLLVFSFLFIKKIYAKTIYRYFRTVFRIFTY